MSISVMQEGEVMGKGVSGNVEARTRARLKAADAYATPIVILGAGPAGLLAAHAVALAGGTPVIFSKPSSLYHGECEKSPMAGAIYLHKPIPDITSAEPDGEIQFVKVGSREGYALKVYYSRFAACSWDKFDEGKVPAWALRPVYEDLWDRYKPQMVPMDLNHEVVAELVENFVSVVNTIPGHQICERKEDDTTIHSFPRRSIWIEPSASPATHVLKETYHAENVIAYDGVHPEVSARYRASIIFGEESTEYVRPQKGAQRGIKITTATDCDCFPEVTRAGRWGCWRPGVLVHHSFERVWNLMFNEFEGQS
jgi:hypothetical protein